jgi:hypothetical protein
MMNCSEISELVASGRSDEIGFAKRLELKMHFFMCKHCRTYAKQINALGIGARRLLGAQEPTAEQMLHLEQQICEKICGGTD